MYQSFLTRVELVIHSTDLHTVWFRCKPIIDFLCILKKTLKNRAMRTDIRAVNSIIAIMLLMAITASAVTGYFLFYKDFTKQSSKNVNMDLPQVTIYGPTSGKPGKTISLWVQNSGNTDFTSWTIIEGASGSGGTLGVGDKAAIGTTLQGQGPWSFKVIAQTPGGKQIEDAWAVKKI